MFVQFLVHSDVLGAHHLGGEFLNLGDAAGSPLLELHFVDDFVHVNRAVLDSGSQLIGSHF